MSVLKKESKELNSASRCNQSHRDDDANNKKLVLILAVLICQMSIEKKSLERVKKNWV
jgi:hypothetical protein